ncbi:MAG: SUF system NifU family Fe-S cluster assembly protein [Actinomycetota bacterium]|jgi:nitrogen fixation NifU-like protein
MPGLDDLYREIILDHYRSPRNRGELAPPAVRAEGHNPLCGDEIQVYLDVVDGVVNDIKITGSGCSISLSSASMMSQAVKGKKIADVKALVNRFRSMMGLDNADSDNDVVSIEDDTEVEAPEVKLGDLEALQGVVKFPVRIKCATLAWITLTQAMAEVPNA